MAGVLAARLPLLRMKRMTLEALGDSIRHRLRDRKSESEVQTQPPWCHSRSKRRRSARKFPCDKSIAVLQATSVRGFMSWLSGAVGVPEQTQARAGDGFIQGRGKHGVGKSNEPNLRRYAHRPICNPLADSNFLKGER